MRNRNISFLKYNIPLKSILLKSGYLQHKKNKDEYIKSDSIGRFHIKVLSKHEVDIHYDLTVEGRHVVFDVPIHLYKEEGRIKSIIKYYKISNEKLQQRKDHYMYCDMYKKLKEKGFKRTSIINIISSGTYKNVISD